MADDVSSVGGAVELSGFKEIDEPAMAFLKNRIMVRIRRFLEICSKFEKLSLKMKKVHAQVHSEKYEIHALVLDKGRRYASTTTHKDLFLAVDAALRKVESEIGEK